MGLHWRTAENKNPIRDTRAIGTYEYHLYIYVIYLSVCVCVSLARTCILCIRVPPT